jgi:protein arginine N-methyltransferase 1
MYNHAALIESQASLLANRERVAAFERAVKGAVKPGDVVVDLGAGMGLLSLLACRAGARKVFAIEPGKVGELAKRLFAVNGVAGKVELIPTASWYVTLPEAADVVMGDLFRGGLRAMGVRQLIDARGRMLKAGGVLLPSRLRMMAAPVHAPREHEARIGVWADLYGFDFSSVQKVAAGRAGPAKFAPGDLAARPEILAEIDAAGGSGPEWRGRACFEFARPAAVHGLAFWLQTELAPGEEISDEPVHPAASWGQQFVPFREAITVNASETVEVEVAIDTVRDALNWTVIARSSDEHESSRQVYAASRDDGAEMIPESRRSAFLRASRSVLESLEASPQTARELTDALIASHGSLFPTRRAAEDLVADLLHRFAEAAPLGRR